MNESKLREKVLPNLSLNNVEIIANCFSGNMDLFAGKLGDCQLSFGVEWACQNGFSLQLNSDKADLESLYDDQIIRYAIQSEIINRYFGWDTRKGLNWMDTEFHQLMTDYAEILTETAMTSSELLKWVKENYK